MDKQRIILATGNRGKLREFQHRLENVGQFELVSQKDLGIGDAEETGITFVENALIKARNASKISGLAAIADDSGLEVDALKGAPGIYSSRYAGPSATDHDNSAQLLKAMTSSDNPTRSARFRCVIVFMRHALDPMPLICQGTWEGQILEQAQGTNGFGYDPLFYIPELNCTSAELDPDTKNRISHRGQALNQFLEEFEKLTF